MNTVDLERLKEKEDAAIKIIDSWSRIWQLPIEQARTEIQSTTLREVQ